MTATDQLLTVEAFDALMSQPAYRDHRLELVDGYLMEKAMPTEEHGIIVGNLMFALMDYLRERKLGRVFAEARYKLSERNVRQPDIAVRLSSDPVWRQGSAPYIPDVAVEVQSPDDTIKGLRERATFYLSVGVKVVVLVLTFKRLIIALTPDDEQIYTLDETLTLALLPEFALPVRDVFKDPFETTGAAPAPQEPTTS
jgi:Uma2 family endonuclease